MANLYPCRQNHRISKLNPISVSCSSLDLCCRVFTSSVALLLTCSSTSISVLFVVRDPELYTGFEMWLYKCRGTKTTLVQPAHYYVLLEHLGPCWHMFSRLLTSTHSFFPSKQLSSHSSPSL